MTFRMPAEWTEHERCLMAWPTRHDLWGAVLAQAKQEYAQVARAIAEFEPVTMVAPPGHGDDARALCGDGIEVIELPLDDSWFRDSGPIFLLGPDGRRAAPTSGSTHGAASTIRTTPTTASARCSWSTSASAPSAPKWSWRAGRSPWTARAP